MKYIRPIFIIILIAGTYGNCYSWDTLAVKYYPLAVGDLWSYHQIYYAPQNCVQVQSQYDFIISIISDTVLPNGKRCFKFSGNTSFQNGFQRIDSSTMNVYKLTNGTECLLDSLKARITNTYYTCRPSSPMMNTFNDTQNINFAGMMRKAKKFNIGPSDLCILMENIGIYLYSECEYGGPVATLNGCIINGVQIGSIIGIENNNEIVPNDFILNQNYPNPFNPTTLIKYAIPQRAFVKITVYDVLGRAISTLTNEDKIPGFYEVVFDGQDLASGLYFYTIQAGLYSQTKKMLLLK